MAGFLATRLHRPFISSIQCLGSRYLRIMHGSASGKSDPAHSFWDEAGSVAVVQRSSDARSNAIASTGDNDSQYPKVSERFAVQTENTEVWRPTAFGFIRLDSDNPPRDQAGEGTGDTGFLDRYFFGDALEEEAGRAGAGESPATAADVPTDTNEIDRQYFYRSQEEEDKGTSSVSAEDLEFEGNEVDEQYFGQTRREGEVPAHDYIKSYRLQLNEDLKAGKLQATGSEEAAGDGVERKSYRTMVPDLTYFPNDMLVSILKRSILHKGGGIVALNKPYGLVTTDADRRSKLVLTDLLPLLAERLGVEKLHTVHRLDRDTTGVLLLASDQQTAGRLTEMFRQHRIKKTYLAITKKVPSVAEGTIDIPVGESTLLDRQRMKLRPVRPRADPAGAAYNARGKSHRAVTHFKVIRTSGSAALVELEPETGARHQLRVHLSQGLDCAILGDHKYSHGDRYAPQKLPDDMLVRLALTQPKVRRVPMHLHAASVSLPGSAEDGGDLSITAPLPPFFRYTLRRLKLTGKRK